MLSIHHQSASRGLDEMKGIHGKGRTRHWGAVMFRWCQDRLQDVKNLQHNLHRIPLNYGHPYEAMSVDDVHQVVCERGMDGQGRIRESRAGERADME